MRSILYLLAGFSFFGAGWAAEQTKTPLVRVIVSPGIVSTLTETPGGDYHVPDSQLFIGGSKAASILGGGLLGLIVANASNASSVENSPPSSKLFFDAQVENAIKSGAASIVNFDLLADQNSNDYNVKLLPSARLLVEKDQIASLSFRLTARLRPAKEDREVTKNFYYGSPARRAISGNGSWLEKDAAIIREEAKIAFERLVFALGEDLAGKTKIALQPENQKHLKIRIAKDRPITSAVLISETPETLIVVPMIGKNLLWAIIQVLDRKSIEIVE